LNHGWHQGLLQLRQLDEWTRQLRRSRPRGSLPTPWRRKASPSCPVEFRAPLFSYRCKTLFPQPTCFEIDTKPPGVSPPSSFRSLFSVACTLMPSTTLRTVCFEMAPRAARQDRQELQGPRRLQGQRGDTKVPAQAQPVSGPCTTRIFAPASGEQQAGPARTEPTGFRSRPHRNQISPSRNRPGTALTLRVALSLTLAANGVIPLRGSNSPLRRKNASI